MARHPLRLRRTARSFQSEGEYGKWLREHAALVKIGAVIFLHGGIHPDLAQLKLDAINARIRDEIKAFDAAKQYLQDEKLILPFFNLAGNDRCGPGGSHRPNASRVFRRMSNARPGSCSSWAMETGSACGLMVHCGFAVTTSGATKRVRRRWAKFWKLTTRPTLW